MPEVQMQYHVALDATDRTLAKVHVGRDQARAELDDARARIEALEALAVAVQAMRDADQGRPHWGPVRAVYAALDTLPPAGDDQ